MVIIIILGLFFALLLGWGAGRGVKGLYGLGFWGVVGCAIGSFFVSKAVNAVLFIAGMVLLALVSWFISLSTRMGRAMKHSSHQHAERDREDS